MADLGNPYQPPVSHVADMPGTVTPDGTYVDGGRAVAAARGWEWIREGYRLFRRHAGVWVLLIVIFFALLAGIHLVPMIGPLAGSLLLPVLIGGLMAGCQAIERGGEIELAHLFAGFRRNTGQLVLVGVIAIGLTIVAMIPLVIALLSAGFFAAQSQNAAGALAVGFGALIGGLVSLALIIPVNMALWFAPSLVMLQDHSAPRAIGESFRGTLKNIVPFLVFGLIVFVLGFLASMPALLGWLVLAPIVICSVYAAYRDIYFQR